MILRPLTLRFAVLVTILGLHSAPASAANEFDDVPQGHPSYYALTYVDTNLGTGVLGSFWTQTIKGKRALTRVEVGYCTWKVVSALRSELLMIEGRDANPIPAESRRGLVPVSMSVSGKRALSDPCLLRSIVVWTEALVRDYSTELKFLGADPEAHLRDLARWQIKPLTLSEAIRKSLNIAPLELPRSDDLGAKYGRFFTPLPNVEDAFSAPKRHPAYDTSQYLLQLGLDRYGGRFGQPKEETRRLDFAYIVARLAFDTWKVCLYDDKRDDRIVKETDQDRLNPRRDLPPGAICGGPPLPRFFRPGDPVFNRLSDEAVLRSALIWLTALYSEFAEDMELMGEDVGVRNGQLTEMRRNITPISQHLFKLSRNRQQIER
jgi:hypothetical protein